MRGERERRLRTAVRSHSRQPAETSMLEKDFSSICSRIRSCHRSMKDPSPGMPKAMRWTMSYQERYRQMPSGDWVDMPFSTSLIHSSASLRMVASCDDLGVRDMNPPASRKRSAMLRPCVSMSRWGYDAIMLISFSAISGLWVRAIRNLCRR